MPAPPQRGEVNRFGETWDGQGWIAPTGQAPSMPDQPTTPVSSEEPSTYWGGFKKGALQSLGENKGKLALLGALLGARFAGAPIIGAMVGEAAGDLAQKAGGDPNAPDLLSDVAKTGAEYWLGGKVLGAAAKAPTALTEAGETLGRAAERVLPWHPKTGAILYGTGKITGAVGSRLQPLLDLLQKDISLGRGVVPEPEPIPVQDPVARAKWRYATEKPYRAGGGVGEMPNTPPPKPPPGYSDYLRAEGQDPFNAKVGGPSAKFSPPGGGTTTTPLDPTALSADRDVILHGGVTPAPSVAELKPRDWRTTGSFSPTNFEGQPIGLSAVPPPSLQGLSNRGLAYELSKPATAASKARSVPTSVSPVTHDTEELRSTPSLSSLSSPKTDIPAVVPEESDPAAFFDEAQRLSDEDWAEKDFQKRQIDPEWNEGQNPNWRSGSRYR